MTIRITVAALRKAARGLIYAGTVLLFAFCFHSCDEELPVYTEPTARLDAKIEGEYFLSDVEHSLRAYVRITNLYDETLDGPASLTGSIVLFAARDTSIHRTFPLTRANLVAGTVNASGILKIDPKETIILKATWDFPGNSVIDDYGRHLSGDSATVHFFSYVQDPTCRFRLFAKPEDFVLQGTVNLFSQRAPVSAGPTIFRFCFVTNFVPVKDCPRIVTTVPCSNWP
jgi:hypothetical protein